MRSEASTLLTSILLQELKNLEHQYFWRSVPDLCQGHTKKRWTANRRKVLGFVLGLLKGLVFLIVRAAKAGHAMPCAYVVQLHSNLNLTSGDGALGGTYADFIAFCGYLDESAALRRVRPRDLAGSTPAGERGRPGGVMPEHERDSGKASWARLWIASIAPASGWRLRSRSML